MKKEQRDEIRTQTEMHEEQEFVELAKHLRNTTDSEEANRLGDRLGRTIFGS